MRTPPKETLRKNLKMLMDKAEMDAKQLSQLSGISLRMVNYVLSGERGATVETAEKLAEPFKISGWQLIMPTLEKDISNNGHLQKLIENYQKADAQGKSLIEAIAAREAAGR